jgi:hypothetical protein
VNSQSHGNSDVDTIISYCMSIFLATAPTLTVTTVSLYGVITSILNLNVAD